MSWQDKVVLNSGERIVRGQRREKGHLGQTEILSFTIVNEQDEMIGEGTYTEHTNVRGLQSSYILNYSKQDGTCFSESW
ncbi:hypothetical protein LVY74_02380 [Acinetobacter sp. ME22]|uniref:hypothetical protein n=1 Tax=Acinetobacter sp. ME22 TaxID=2904802 RepID=UPI001EDA7DAA|nr:hypothetical protein [Acinetobacter sp. ME22]MCG2572405.1 hypothetical protein [Acinetobacter sp. ME22]